MVAHMAHTREQNASLCPQGRGPTGLRKAAVVTLLVVMVGLLVPGMAGLASSATTSSSGDRVIVPMLFPFLQYRSWEDDWGAPRTGHTHEGNDILAPKGTPVVAVVSGTLDWMNFDGKISSYNNYPYYNILLRGDDGNDYFYIHLNNDSPVGDGTYTDDGMGGPEHAYAPGLKNGSRVTAGQIIGYTGDSGNAEDSIPHLHFEIHIGGWKNPVNPYWSLKAAPTYDDWIASGGGPIVPRTTGTGGSTTTRSTTTTLPTTSTTRAPGGQIEPGMPRFTDVSRSDWFYADLELLCVAGVVKGSPAGTFEPYATITRAQFTALLARAFLQSALQSPSAVGTQAFTDVKPSYWGYKEIQAAAAAGLVKGVDGKRFAPESLITRAQMAVMLCRALDAVAGGSFAPSQPARSVSFRDVPVSYWARAEVLRAAGWQLVNGYADGYFRPESKAQRCQAVAVLARALRLYRNGAGS